NRNYRNTDSSFKLILFKMLVHPIVTYGISIWFNQTQQMSTILDGIYKTAARLFTRNYDFNVCCTRILIEMGFPSWRMAEVINGLKITYNILYGKSIIPYDKYFKVQTCPIPNRPDIYLQRGRSRCNSHLHSPVERNIIRWNSLPKNISNSLNIDIFTERLKT